MPFFLRVQKGGDPEHTTMRALYRLADLFCDVTFAQAHWVCVRKSSALQIACGDSGISPFFCTQNCANSLQREFPGFDANSDITFSLVFECFDGTMIAIAIIVEKITRCEWFVRNIKSNAFSVRQKLELESDRNLFECF